MEHGLIFCGANVERITGITTVAEVMTDLKHGFMEKATERVCETA